jgi:hypothetical protein
MKKTKLGEELPKISRACVNNANPLPSLYNNTCSEREIINKRDKTKSLCFTTGNPPEQTVVPLHRVLLSLSASKPQIRYP